MLSRKRTVLLLLFGLIIMSFIFLITANKMLLGNKETTNAAPSESSQQIVSTNIDKENPIPIEKPRMTQEEIALKTKQIIDELGMDPIQTNIEIDPYDGKLVNLWVKNWSQKVIIKSESEARNILLDQYKKIGAPSDYKLIRVQRDYAPDWSGHWAKEVIPGVFSELEAVNLLISTDQGKLIFYKHFNEPPKSTEVKVTKEQAIEIANARMIKVFGSQGSDGLSASDAKLQVVKSTNNSTSPGLLDSKDPYVTLAWVVKYPYKGQISGWSVLYVDANTGDVIGFDQTL